MILSGLLRWVCCIYLIGLIVLLSDIDYLNVDVAYYYDCWLSVVLCIYLLWWMVCICCFFCFVLYDCLLGWLVCSLASVWFGLLWYCCLGFCCRCLVIVRLLVVYLNLFCGFTEFAFAGLNVCCWYLRLRFSYDLWLVYVCVSCV